MATTLNNPKHLDDLESEHQLWKSQASFDNDELKVYQKRLEEIAAKNSKGEVLKQIEHFQNQFFIQNEELDVIRHEINIHKQRLAEYAKANPVAIDDAMFPDHQQMHDKVEMFKKIYAELKKEFNNFLTVWL
jgi:hypothetical protein